MQSAVKLVLLLPSRAKSTDFSAWCLVRSAQCLVAYNMQYKNAYGVQYQVAYSVKNLVAYSVQYQIVYSVQYNKA